MSLRPPAAAGMRLDEVDTPALILELDAFETNLKRLVRAVAGRVRVRGGVVESLWPITARGAVT